MGNSQVFDYDQPTRDSLAGIYVEASDEALEQGGGVDTRSAGQSAPQPASTFRLTLTADDSANVKQSNARLQVADRRFQAERIGMSGHPLVVVGIGHDGPPGLSQRPAPTSQPPASWPGVAAISISSPTGRAKRLFSAVTWRRLSRRCGPAIGRKSRSYWRRATPLFYGIGRALLEAIPREDLVFLPQVSSVQLAFARVKETWHDAHVVSLHGRPAETLIAAVRVREPKIAVLTDATNKPGIDRPAFFAVPARAEGVRLWVCENLGGAGRTDFSPRPASLRDETFSRSTS